MAKLYYIKFWKDFFTPITENFIDQMPSTDKQLGHTYKLWWNYSLKNLCCQQLFWKFNSFWEFPNFTGWVRIDMNL